MARIPYTITDEAAAKITLKIHRAFRQNRLALFDEMNTLQVKKHVHKLYQSINSAVKNEIFLVLKPLQNEIYEEALALGFDGDLRDLDEAWIEEFFDEFDPVTKYVFKNEMVRKEARLFEDLVAVMKTPGTDKMRSYKTAENLLIRQIKQAAINLEDAVVMAVFKAVGVKKVEWVAEDDHKTCKDCNALDGKVFDIKDAPPKLHIHCRCYFIPVKG